MYTCFDLHNHTVASGHAYSTIEEIAARAKDRGLQLVGIADHGPAMPGGPHLYYFGNHGQVPRQIDGMEIRFGVEANIISTDGKLTCQSLCLRNWILWLQAFMGIQVMKAKPRQIIQRRSLALWKTLMWISSSTPAIPGFP